ncbi:MAG: ferrochelatase [Rhodanobacteraceae bacterium]|nr:ferrochelatase [Rhodanobacteraceae bacterium]
MLGTKRYYAAPAGAESGRGDIAVVLVNLGTPAAPTASAVRRYLGQFLADPRVVEQPRWLWWLILHGVILRLRPARSARAYARIWTDAGSPLLVQSQALARALDLHLQAHCEGSVCVRLAMTYGEPALPEVIRQLVDRGIRRVLVLPLYPQYSATSTGAVFDALALTIQSLRWPPELRTVGDYHDQNAHIEALARSVERHWAAHGPAERLLLSFHGIPKRYVEAGDPYATQCRATAARLAARLGLAADTLIVSFQSRVGREEWLRPYTDLTLEELARAGVRSIQVLCPGFAVDCLETLEEIALENRERFLHAGGERYEYIPALNDAEDQVTALAALVAQHLQGWVRSSDAQAPVSHVAA